MLNEKTFFHAGALTATLCIATVLPGAQWLPHWLGGKDGQLASTSAVAPTHADHACLLLLVAEPILGSTENREANEAANAELLPAILH